MITQQQSEYIIMQSGALEYPWWMGVERSHDYAPEWPFDAPDGWRWALEIVDPDDETKEKWVSVQHGDLVNAARKVAFQLVKATPELWKQARLFLFKPEEADFDAEIADELLQIAVFGHSVYG